jgi:Fusaric acid resistance protein-like
VTIASLFLLAFPTSHPWPDPVWILFTCIFVTWQPSIDAGTAFKKFIERLGGTLFGAVLAFGVGYLSLAVGTVEGQAVFLGFVFAIEGFLYPYLADRLGYRNSYGALVGNLTFAIAVFAFYNPKGDDPPWFTPLYRCLNVLIGCVIAATVSVIVYPVSTRTLLIRNVRALIAATGTHTGMALQAAADSFESGTKPRALSVLLRDMDAGNAAPDPVHASYVKNLDVWKSTRALIPILKYDPWFWTMQADERGEFKHAMHILLVRTLRIQMNIVLLDSILRSDAEYKGPTEAIKLLPAIGRRIETALSVKLLDAQERKAAVQEMIDEHLPLVRAQIVQAAAQSQSSGGDSTTAPFPSFARLESMLEAGALPFSVLNQQGGQTLLYFQLVEQLILRVAKLHFCLQQYQSCDSRRKCDGCSLS